MFHLESYGFGDAAHREIASHAIAVAAERLHTRALKCDLRILGHIKEIGPLQVTVPPRLVGIDAGRIDLDFNLGRGGRGFIELQRTAPFGETAVNLRDYKMPDREMDAGMDGIDLPRFECHWRLLVVGMLDFASEALSYTLLNLGGNEAA